MTEAQFITLSLSLAVHFPYNAAPQHPANVAFSSCFSTAFFFPLAFQTVRLWDVNELFTCVSAFLPLKNTPMNECWL